MRLKLSYFGSLDVAPFSELLTKLLHVSTIFNLFKNISSECAPNRCALNEVVLAPWLEVAPFLAVSAYQVTVGPSHFQSVQKHNFKICSKQVSFKCSCFGYF